MNVAMLQYWGKADKDGDITGRYHLLPYHGLDVAAVGSVMFDQYPRLKRNVCSVFGFDERTSLSLFLFFLAIHDIGKFSERFQNLNKDLFIKLQGHTCNKRYIGPTHTGYGFALWKHYLISFICTDVQSTDTEKRKLERSYSYIARAVTGHHGKPPIASGGPGGYAGLFSQKDLDAVGRFIEEIKNLFLSDISLTLPIPEDAGKKIKTMSWYLAGLTTLCDWIGSNRDFFKYVSDEKQIDDYWNNIALIKARKAVEHAGVLPARPSRQVDAIKLFDNVTSLRPTQEYAQKCQINSDPQLFIIEDLTGSGKTETAIILAHKIMQAGLADGLYIALPTMATANAMYTRLAKTYKRLFRGDNTPSLALAHGSSKLSKEFQQSILTQGHIAKFSYSEDEEDASAQCASWIADNRKKALLADVGVGTIDQALLSVLPSKYQSLRLLGLSSKVLIVDEIHAYDSYMHSLLRTLLTFQASMGGSCILLSATLSKKSRQELAEAFAEGLKSKPVDLENTRYPLITHIGKDQKEERAISTSDVKRKTIKAQFLHKIEDAENYVVASASQGRSVCWIRNTVSDALTAYEQLLKRIDKKDIMLFHARFAMGDRLDIEKKTLACFGSSSDESIRCGKVLIATQVVEQSLDLDFDVMISDLAPIDLLIQRAGRLHRHARDKKGSKLSGADAVDERDEPCLAIYGPDPDETVSKEWYKSYFSGASFVYPDHGKLWLTAKLLKKQGGWTMPDDARYLVESVYGENAYSEISESLKESSDGAEGQDMTGRGMAQINSLNINSGYVYEQSWLDDTVAPTRLGDLQTTVRLARWDGGQLRPWCDTGDFPWEMSQVNVRSYWIKDEVGYDDPRLREAVAQARETMPDKGKWSVLVVLEKNEHGLWFGRAVNYEGDEVEVRYSTDTGIKFIKEEGQDGI